jgi:hypothetical protein
MIEPPAGVKIHGAGRWDAANVKAHWVESGRKIVAAVEERIERAWSEASARLGAKVFDGPMCRLERWEAGRTLELFVSRTSYKTFLGTNLMNAALAERYGVEVLANAAGLSVALTTADGWLLLGQRNSSVAYYPDRVHPFAGALEPGEPLDVFAEAQRELDEELSLKRDELGEMFCIGMVEDCRLRQPELVFEVTSRLSREEIEERLDPAEHRGVYGIAAEREAVARAMRDAALTPVAAGVLALWEDGKLGA